MPPKDKTTSNTELCRHFISQLNSLVPVLALADESVFYNLHKNYNRLFSRQKEVELPEVFQDYSTQLCHALFVLGYAYAETFITKVIWNIYYCHQNLLPQDESLKFSEILSLENYEEIVSKMISDTLESVDSLEKKIRHLETQLDFKFSKSEQLFEAQSIRNAIVYNYGRINIHQSPTAQWQFGDTVELTINDVNEFGVTLREYAREISVKADELCCKE